MRAKRRFKDRCIKKKRRDYWGYNDNPKLSGKKLNAPKPTSSCMCCCNRRLVEGDTRQEKKSKLSMLEQCE